MTANLRMVRGDTMERCEAYIRKQIRDPDIQVRRIQGATPLLIPPRKARPGKWSVLPSGNLAECHHRPVYDDGLQRFPAFLPDRDHVLRFSAMELSKEERGEIPWFKRADSHGKSRKSR